MTVADRPRYETRPKSLGEGVVRHEVRLDPDQAKWLDDEVRRTGFSRQHILRRLVQDRMDEASREPQAASRKKRAKQ